MKDTPTPERPERFSTPPAESTAIPANRRVLIAELIDAMEANAGARAALLRMVRMGRAE
jgi:hypothetical protein